MIVTFFRIALGLFFVVSGALKLQSPIEFYDAVYSFRLINDPLISLTALAVPTFEVVVGLLVVFGVWKQTAMTWLLGSLVFFTALILLSWLRGLDITCGCFGGTGDTNYPVKLLQNAALISVSAWVWWKVYLIGENVKAS